MDQAESLARHAIRATAERYFFAADTRDTEMMVGCFADSFRFELQLDPTVVISTPGALRRLLGGFVPPVASNHALSNMLIELTPEGATSTIHAIAYLSMAETQTVLVRGLRYTDRWVQQQGGWRIASRLHQPRWQYDAPATAPRVFGAK
jgi:hypothetical protein